VVLEVPGVRGTCSVYFLDRIKIRGSKFHTQTLKVEREGTLVRNIDLNELKKLPLDENAYHILAIEEDGRMKQGHRRAEDLDGDTHHLRTEPTWNEELSCRC
jgi:hypothetical protein